MPRALPRYFRHQRHGRKAAAPHQLQLQGQPLVAEKLGYGRGKEIETIEFALDESEALYGAGARAVGMNRRGNRFQLYNKAIYGLRRALGTAGLYDSGGAVLERVRAPLRQSAGRLARFRQPQGRHAALRSHRRTQNLPGSGGRQLGRRHGGLHRPDGRQPLPPRWAFGNFASRFGYHSEAETRAVVDKFIAEKIPLDAIVLDLYWFGKTVKGTMGNLDWDRDSFPHAEQMMADFKKKGVKTVVISEPFVLTTSKRWQEAVDARCSPPATGQALHLRFLLREHRPDRPVQARRPRLALGHLQGPQARRRQRLVGRPGRAGSASGGAAARERSGEPSPQYLRPRLGAPDRGGLQRNSRRSGPSS